METRPNSSCVNVYSFAHTKTLHHSTTDMWGWEEIIYTDACPHAHSVKHTVPHLSSSLRKHRHTRKKKRLQLSHLWFKCSCARMCWRPIGCCHIPSENRQRWLSFEQPLLSQTQPSMVKGSKAMGLTDRWASVLEPPARCPRKHSSATVEQKALWLGTARQMSPWANVSYRAK